MDMNAASILRSKTVAIVSAGFLGAGLLGGVALAAAPTTMEAVRTTTPATGTAVANDERGKARLKAALDALVAKNVITQAQEDAIIAALSNHDTKDHPKLHELVGDVLKESVSYLGLPADQVKHDLGSGESLVDLDAGAAQRIQAAVAAGTLTQAQADELTPKVDAAIVKIVDRKHAPKPAAGTTTAKPAKPTN
jgi:hypothetical protein